jgi:hypothetical protein
MEKMIEEAKPLFSSSSSTLYSAANEALPSNKMNTVSTEKTYLNNLTGKKNPFYDKKPIKVVMTDNPHLFLFY